MIRRFTALLLIFIVLSLPISALAAEPAGNGTITGQLVNRTAGGKSVADIEVQLKTLLNNQETASATAKTRNDGKFTYNNLSTDSKYSYQATFTYQEAEYSGDIVSFAVGETTKSIEVAVYDATNSDKDIKVPQAHTVISVGQGSLEIMEVYLFSHDTDRAYIGAGEITATGKRKTLDFPLPAKATEIQYGDGLMECCVLPSQEGFIDTMPVLPEGREIIYAYKVPYSGSTYTFAQKINYPISQFNLLVKGDGYNIVSDQLATQAPQNMGGTNYSHLTGQDLTPGDTIVAKLSGLPKSTNQKAVIIWVAGALVVLGVGSALAYQRTRGKTTAQPIRAESRSDRRQEQLLIELAHLDDAFAAGQIEEKAYRNQRAAKKAQLVKLVSISREASGRQ